MSRYSNPVPYAIDGNGTPIVGAKLNFYETGTTTPKTIYSDSGLTTPASNPAEADGDGQFSDDIFLDGIYKVVYTDADDVTIWTKDPVGAAVEGQLELWTSDNTYNIPEMVLGSDDEYYRSLSDGNQGNNPTTDAVNWEQLRFGRIWNTNITYAIGDTVYGSDGYLYAALVSQSGNTPVGDTTNWNAAVTGAATLDITGNADTVTTIPTLSGDVSNTGNAINVDSVQDDAVDTDGIVAEAVTRDKIQTTDISLAGALPVTARVPILLSPYTFFPMIHQTGTDAYLLGHVSDGLGADNARFAFYNPSASAATYDVDYRYITNV